MTFTGDLFQGKANGIIHVPSKLPSLKGRLSYKGMLEALQFSESSSQDEEVESQVMGFCGVSDIL